MNNIFSIRLFGLLVFVLLGLFLGSLTNFKAQAQPPATANKQSKITAKGLNKQLDTRERLIFELTHDRWQNTPDGVKTKWYNRGFNAFVLYDYALIGRNLSLGFGGGIANNNIYNNAKLVNLDTTAILVPISDSLYQYKKNKLETSWFEIPLELRFRTNPDKINKTFKIALGLRGGYLLDSKIKYKGEDLTNTAGTGDNVFIKTKRLPHISKYRLGYTARVGYANFNLFWYQSLTPLFKKGEGPDIIPFSIGFSFNSL